jgi:hypothetical protein
MRKYGDDAIAHLQFGTFHALQLIHVDLFPKIAQQISKLDKVNQTVCTLEAIVHAGETVPDELLMYIEQQVRMCSIDDSTKYQKRMSALFGSCIMHSNTRLIPMLTNLFIPFFKSKICTLHMQVGELCPISKLPDLDVEEQKAIDREMGFLKEQNSVNDAFQQSMGISSKDEIDSSSSSSSSTTILKSNGKRNIFDT